MLRIVRTDSSHPDFRQLVTALDAYLAVIDGKDHAFYAQYNKTGDMKTVLLAYLEDVAVGCGAIRPYDERSMEVKRMYVLPEQRGKGIAAAILRELETWSRELGYARCILETGKKQTDAIALYQKHGYLLIPNYGQYAGIENSVCFEKLFV